MAYGHRLRFGIVLGQRAPFAVLAERARETEALGFDTLMVVDHFYGLFDVMEPTHEAYTMLAALATVTNRVRLGVLVTGNTYRNPAFLLKQALTVDDISGGRLDFGVGSGWTEREHEAFGFAFPATRDRVGMFAEALDIWELLQANERTTYDGVYYQLLDAPFEPKSRQGRLPILIGAQLPRMLRLTAKYADVWNARGTPEEAAAVNQQLTRFCEEIGRDPAAIDIVCSTYTAVSPSGDRQADIRHVKPEASFFYSVLPRLLEQAGFDTSQRAPAKMPHPDMTHAYDWEEAMAAADTYIPDEVVEAFCLVGPPEAAIARIEELRSLGVTQMYIRGASSYHLPRDLVETFRDHVLPAFR